MKTFIILFGGFGIILMSLFLSERNNFKTMSKLKYEELEILYMVAKENLSNEPDGHRYIITIEDDYDESYRKYTYINKFTAELEFSSYNDIPELYVKLYTDNIHHKINGGVEYLPGYKLDTL